MLGPYYVGRTLASDNEPKNPCCVDTCQMGSDYYSVDEILLEETAVLMKMNADSVGVGFLDFPHNKTPDLPANSKISAPLWLAEILSRKSLGTASCPEYFGPHIRDLLERGALCFQAQPKNAEFFVLALRISGSLLNGDRGLFRSALFALTVRLQQLFESLLFAALPPSEDAEQHLLQRQLSLTEAKFFAKMKALCEESRLWKIRKLDLIKPVDSHVFPRDLLSP